MGHELAAVEAAARWLLRAVQQEGHALRVWNAKQDPASFRQQWLKRVVPLHNDERTRQARTFLKALSYPNLEVTWTTAQSGTSLVRTLTGHADMVNAVAVTPDGRHAVSGSPDKTLRVWDLAAGVETACIILDAAAHCVAVAPDSRTFVAGDAVGNLWCLRYWS